jgi:valyl-tRNA synthetase
MNMELPKAYNPKQAEETWYPHWKQLGLFHARANPDKKPYTIVIPPPNITGILTMGHVLNNTIQDVFVRWKRMQGFETLWMPGTDHAGIATQNVVEKALMKEGKTRHDLGREKFVERVWGWKKEYGGTIIKQLKKLGTSCDWERERFTMDEGLSNAVQEIFIRLYKKGLIYRGKYIINWCPNDHTAISDDEVEYTEQQGHLWHIRYPIKGTDEFAIVATTRPETMLGDTAIAVHPKDKRYKKLVGKTAILPLANREIPVIADDYVDPSFGTGMVKVTPAHDPNDYWIGQRHNLPQINIMSVSASLNENVPEQYRGMDRFVARKAVVKDLQAAHSIEKIEEHTHSVGRCYRCDTIIEPYLSDQWFVKMKPLAGPALKVVQNGTIRFHPERWTKVYEHWMTNIRDWCISRQLWWGHRIPVWYCTQCDYMTASKSKPSTPCPQCGGKAYRQDEDVLDTWFSSWLWPLSTLNWPNDNPDLRYFYPTELLVTGPDIIFFWVARMIMAGMEVMGEIPLPDGSLRKKAKDIVPFHHVYFTSIVRDIQGRKMSKSLGNSPDPLDVIAEYGADALRFTIVYLAPLGQDVLFSTDKCEIGRNFANKLWNAGRFLLMNKEQIGVKVQGPKFNQPETLNLKPEIIELHLDLADRWILSRLHSTIGDLNNALENFEINQATKLLYDFAWHDFCDWYVEMVKSRLYGDEPGEVKQDVLGRALGVFDTMLRMIHPFMPFVTEELWQRLEERKKGESIMVLPFPVVQKKWIDKETESEMEFVQRCIESLRNIRGEMSIAPSKEIQVKIRFHNKRRASSIQKYAQYFARLARVNSIEPLPNGQVGKKLKASASAVVDGEEIFVPLEGIIDLRVERERIQKEITRVRTMLEGVQKKLANRDFLAKAPKEVVENERMKLENFEITLEKLEKNYRNLTE